MERINQYAFYALGKTFQELRRFGDDASVSVVSVFFKLADANEELEKLIAGKPVPLGISKNKAVNLQGQMRDILHSCLNKNEEGQPVFPHGSERPIESWKWRWMLRAMDDFETVFSEEMSEAATYFVPRRGMFHTPVLVDSAHESFPGEIAGSIPEKTKVDWRAAGRCLAFNLLSAAGFHTARAVEGTLEAYYQRYSGKPGQTLANWGQYLQHLETIQKAGGTPAPQERTLAEFRQMKDDYRNPIVHPRVDLSESDAKMLFNNGESLIIAMAQEIQAASLGTQLNLISAEPVNAMLAPVEAEAIGKNDQGTKRRGSKGSS